MTEIQKRRGLQPWDTVVRLALVFFFGALLGFIGAAIGRATAPKTILAPIQGATCDPPKRLWEPQTGEEDEIEVCTKVIHGPQVPVTPGPHSQIEIGP